MTSHTTADTTSRRHAEAAATEPVPASRAGRWPETRATRIPAWIYSDAALFEREMEVFQNGPTWNFVGLECEIETPGAFKRSWVGPRSGIIRVKSE